MTLKLVHDNAKSPLSEVFEIIEDFLSTKKKREGSKNANVSTLEMDELTKIINLIIKEKYECDSHGDLPVEFSLVDRTKCWSLGFQPVPYGHGYQNAVEAHLVSLGNLKRATEQTERLNKIVMRKLHLVDKNAPEQ